MGLCPGSMCQRGVHAEPFYPEPKVVSEPTTMCRESGARVPGCPMGWRAAGAGPCVS